VKNFTVKFPTVAEKKQIIWGITFCRTVYLFQITKFHETEKCTDTTKNNFDHISFFRKYLTEVGLYLLFTD